MRTSIVLVAALLATTAVAAPLFTDVAVSAGINRVLDAGSPGKKHLIESLGAGVALWDYDNDGDLDIFMPNGWEVRGDRVTRRAGNALFRNAGDGAFEDVTARSGLTGRDWSVGVAVADVDNDGWLDLYVTNVGPNRLYRNRGDGSFEEIALVVGVAGDRWSTGAAFLDYDLDGDCDLYVANYVDATTDEALRARRSSVWRGVTRVMEGPRGMPGAADVFYRNNGDGTFDDVTAESGLLDVGDLYGLGVCTTDYDADGFPDIYVANDAAPNYLYRNNGDATFTELGLFSGVSLSGAGLEQAGMGVDIADYDGDGRDDMVVTNFSGEHTTLYAHGSGHAFDDVSAAVGISLPTYLGMGWGVHLFDFDNDADLDLFIANGHIYPQVTGFPEYGETYAQRNQLFRNDAGRFVEVVPADGSALAQLRSSRGSAVGDLDNDGDLDLVVMNMDGPPSLLRNDVDSFGAWLSVRLEGTLGNRSAIGAVVTLSVGATRQRREIRSGSSFVSHSDLRAHFGLGDVDHVDALSVRWPSGAITSMENVPARQFITVVEPR